MPSDMPSMLLAISTRKREPPDTGAAVAELGPEWGAAFAEAVKSGNGAAVWQSFCLGLAMHEQTKPENSGAADEDRGEY